MYHKSLKLFYLLGRLKSIILLYTALMILQQNIVFGQTNLSSVIDGLNWEEVSTDGKRIQIFELISNQTKANHSKINTWKGTYQIHSEQFLVKDFLVKNFSGRVKSGELADALQKNDFLFKFAIDVHSKSYYRSQENNNMTFVNAKTGALIEISRVAGVQERSIATPEHYIHFDPKETWPAFSYLPEHPKAKNRRTAFRESPKMAKMLSDANLPDPLLLYGFSPIQKFWEELNLYIPVMKGKQGKELLKKTQDRVKIFKADTQDGIWYKISMHLGEQNKFYMTTVWSPSAGLNPVRLIHSKDFDSQQEYSRTEWEWKSYQGIFLPQHVIEKRYSREDKQLTFLRELTLEESEINPTLDKHQFDYIGLGMKDSELVLDKIDEIAYNIKDGKLKKLANFGDKYNSPTTSDEGSPTIQQWFIIGILIFFAILGIYFWNKRSKNAGSYRNKR